MCVLVGASDADRICSESGDVGGEEVDAVPVEIAARLVVVLREIGPRNRLKAPSRSDHTGNLGQRPASEGRTPRCLSESRSPMR